MTREMCAAQLILRLREIERWNPSMRLPCEAWLIANEAVLLDALIGTEVSA